MWCDVTGQGGHFCRARLQMVAFIGKMGTNPSVSV